ncbi:MAG: hypothetical protein ACI915_002281 [Gammaproteobacteria bacterium]|jgi:hypothetical protein
MVHDVSFCARFELKPIFVDLRRFEHDPQNALLNTSTAQRAGKLVIDSARVLWGSCLNKTQRIDGVSPCWVRLYHPIRLRLLGSALI